MLYFTGQVRSVVPTLATRLQYGSAVQTAGGHLTNLSSEPRLRPFSHVDIDPVIDLHLQLRLLMLSFLLISYSLIHLWSEV